jgi:hypothetical protein
MGEEKKVKEMTLTFNVTGDEGYDVTMKWTNVRLSVVFLVEKLLAEAQGKMLEEAAKL